MSLGKAIISGSGILSFRYANYSTYSALAEIIDNSIQAGAKNIHIMAIQREEWTENSGLKVRRLREIIVYDDGEGINKEIMDECLRYGGGSRHNAIKGLGKFGMGLPSASGSQSNRTEVYSWKNSSDPLYTYQDFKEMEKSDEPRLPKTITKKVPRNIANALSNIVKGGSFDPLSKEHGTVIYWKECGKRINHSTFAAFYRNFEKEIGRIYRYFINKRKLNITLTGFNKIKDQFVLLKNKDHIYKVIRANDPLFLMSNTLVGDYDPRFKNKSTNILHQETKEIKASGNTYKINIKSSYLDYEVRKKLGFNNPGGSPLGMNLYKPSIGVSLLREDRELKLNNFGFIGDVSLPQNRFWSVEVNFGPELDELFDVTYDKQEARAFRKIDEKEYKEELSEAEDESLNLMYELSIRITEEIKTMYGLLEKQTAGTRKKKIICKECGEKEFSDNKCGSCGYTPKFCQKHDDTELEPGGVCAICLIDDESDEFCTKHSVKIEGDECERCKNERNEPGDVLSNQDEERLRVYLCDNFTEYKKNKAGLDKAINYLKKVSRNQLIIYTNSDASTFFSYSDYGKITIIDINKNHSYYEKFIDEFVNDENRIDSEIIPINLLIGSFVAAEREDYMNKEILSDFRASFSLKLKKLMRDYTF
tara:strand:+ start:1853 stop:3796 length:1944 start_codon:yes stop_codon:yes gene_type:complete